VVSASDTYGVNITDEYGCTSYCEVEVTVYDAPTCSIDADPGTEVCAGNNVTLSEDGGDATSWNWTTGETTQSIVVSASDTYGVNITDEYGCTSYCEVEITVEVCENCEAIAGNFSICAGTTVNEALFAPYVGCDGPECCNITSLNYSEVSANIDNPGIYSYNVTCGCEEVYDPDTATGYVTIYANPEVDITPDGGVLDCATTFIILTADTSESPCSVNSYRWYKGGSLLSETSDTLTVTEPGTYKVEVECENNCEASDSVVVTQDIDVPTVNVPNVVVCEGETATLTATVSGCTAKSYQWYKGTSSSGTLIPGATSKTYSIPNASAADAVAYTCLVECEGGCKGEDYGKLTVNHSPTANFNGSPRSGCAPLTVVFTDQSTGDPTNWNWTFTGGSPSSANTPGPHAVTYNSSGTYTVSLTVSNDCGPGTETKPVYITVEDCGPTISVQQIPEGPYYCAGEDVLIRAHVTDNVGVTSVNLTYDGMIVAMNLVSGTAQDGYWEATIPGQPAGTTFTIVVTATDGENTVSSAPHDKIWIDCAGPWLNIIKTDSPGTVNPGGTLTYNIIVTNTGNVTATGVRVVDDYDENVLNITDTDNGFDNGDTITWNGWLTIPSGGSLSYAINATVSPTATRGSTFYNTANVTCAEGSSAFDDEYTNVAGGGGGGVVGGGSCPTFKKLTVDWEGTITEKRLYRNDRLTQDLLGPSPDGSHNLLLERSTLAPLVGGRTHYLIVIRELDDIPPTSGNTTVIMAFNVTPEGAVFDRDIFLTLGFDQLPENALNATMAYYDAVNGVWVPLMSEAGGPNGVAELTLSAAVNHFSIFGVLVELEPTPILPAHFEASGLNIVPSVEKIWEPVTFVTKTGESVTITANVVNDGGQEGTYTVELKLNGETVDTKTVTLGVGQSQEVSFTVSGLDYGQYEVEVAGLNDDFTTSRTITWWLIIVLIVALGVIIWGVAWGRRKRRSATVEG